MNRVPAGSPYNDYTPNRKSVSTGQVGKGGRRKEEERTQREDESNARFCLFHPSSFLLHPLRYPRRLEFGGLAMRTTWTFHSAGQLIFGRNATQHLGEVCGGLGLKRLL